MKSLFGKKLVNKLAGDHGYDLPPDKLNTAVLRTDEDLLVGHSGLPTTADSLAYEPTQRILAVGCADGRIKILGKAGVERTLFTNDVPGVPTQQLLFLLNRGVMLRVTKGGTIESWNVDGSFDEGRPAPLHVLRLSSDAVQCVAALSKEPYLLLGCASGALRVASLVNSSGITVTEARPVKSLKLLPYQVKPSDLEASGSVRMVSAWSTARQHLLLSLHSGSGASVWDVRATKLLVTINPHDESSPTPVKDAGSITAVSWTSSTGKRPEFATGHITGDICVWSLPTYRSISEDGSSEVPELQCNHRLTQGPAARIRRLEFVVGRMSSMLVLGGQAEDEPEALAVIPLSASSGKTAAVTSAPTSTASDDDGEAPAHSAKGGDSKQPVKLPWLGNILGYAMVPSKGSVPGFEEVAAIATLMQGGRMFVHNLASTKPVNTSHAFQTINTNDRITCGKVFSIPSTRPAGQAGGHCSLQGLRFTGKPHKQEADSPELQLMLAGGNPPECMLLGGQEQVYVTGYGDGMVRLWEVSSDVPQLLAVAPSPGATEVVWDSNERSRAVTCLEFCGELGLLITGHQRGEVRIFQYQEKGGPSKLAVISSIATAQHKLLAVSEEPGLQTKAVCQIHGADITCVSLDASSKMLAAVDSMGLVSLTDISKPMVLWLQQASNQPIRSLALSTCPLPPHRDRSPGCTREQHPEGAIIKAIHLAAADCSAAVLDAEKGCLVGAEGWLRPKHPSEAVFMALLDASGQPLWMGAKKGAGTAPTSPVASDAAVVTAAASSGAVGATAGLTGVAHTASDASSQQASTERATSGSVDADDDEEDEQDEVSAPASPSKSSQKDDDGDVDEYLAAAAAAVETSPIKKQSVLKTFLEKKKKNKKKGLVKESLSDPSDAAGSGHGKWWDRKEKESDDPPITPKGGGIRRERPDLLRNSSTPATPVAPSSPPKSPQAAVTSAAPAPVGVSASAPAAISTEARLPQEPSPTFMLMCTSGYLRVYPIMHVVCGDRTTLKKVSVNGRLVHAAVFEAGGAPGLLAFVQRDADVYLQVHSLPNLELLSESSLSRAIPYLAMSPDELVQFAMSAAFGRTGEILLVGPGNELVRLAATTTSRNPLPPTELYDWDLAAAAHAAHVAMENAAMRTAPGGVPTSASGRRASMQAERPDRSTASPADTPTATEGRRKSVLGGALSKFQQNVNQALNETTKHVQHLVNKVDSDLSKLISKDGEREPQSPQYPELSVIFSQVVEEADGSLEDDVNSAGQPSSQSAAGGRANGSAPPAQDAPLTKVPMGTAPVPARSGRMGSVAAGRTTEEQRNELFAGAEPPKQLKVRTADEIKAAYGRAAASKAAGDVGATMAENRNKLDERGERLNKLAERSAAMESEAADFAALAKRIADDAKNKKWWQL